jgi:hypothetical protein
MAKVKINKKVKSVKALATQLLGGKGVANAKQIKILTAKIKKLNKDKITTKGQDLLAGQEFRVGRLKGTKAGTLMDDTRTPARYTIIRPTPVVLFQSSYSKPAETPNSETSIKIATPDIIILDDQPIEVEIMTDLIFENIGGQEIINISRNDIVNGQEVIYSPIKNLSKINLQFNSRNILSTENNSSEYFENFPIKLEQKIPETGTGENGEIIYIDTITGDLIINVVNIETDEQVEVQILEAGSIINDTIYGEQI